MHKLTSLEYTFWILEMKDGVIISEEVDFIDSKRMGIDFFNDILNNFIVSCLY